MNIQKLEDFINQLTDNLLWSGATVSTIRNYMELIKSDIESLQRHSNKPKFVNLYNNRIAENYKAMCEFIRSKNENIKEIPPIEK